MSELIWANKTIDALSREELMVAVLHFRNAHVDSFFRMTKMSRRMEKMELGISKANLAKIDWWLEKHPHDIFEGDGRPTYWPWTAFKLTENGYRTHGDNF